MFQNFLHLVLLFSTSPITETLTTVSDLRYIVLRSLMVLKIFMREGLLQLSLTWVLLLVHFPWHIDANHGVSAGALLVSITEILSNRNLDSAGWHSEPWISHWVKLVILIMLIGYQGICVLRYISLRLSFDGAFFFVNKVNKYYLKSHSALWGSREVLVCQGLSCHVL